MSSVKKKAIQGASAGTVSLLQVGKSFSHCGCSGCVLWPVSSSKHCPSASTVLLEFGASIAQGVSQSQRGLFTSANRQPTGLSVLAKSWCSAVWSLCILGCKSEECKQDGFNVGVLSGSFPASQHQLRTFGAPLGGCQYHPCPETVEVSPAWCQPATVCWSGLATSWALGKVSARERVFLGCRAWATLFKPWSSVTQMKGKIWGSPEMPVHTGLWLICGCPGALLSDGKSWAVAVAAVAAAAAVPYSRNSLPSASPSQNL